MTTRHVCSWPTAPCDWCADTIDHLQPCQAPGCFNCVDDRDPATGDLVTTVDPDNPDRTIQLWHCNLCLGLPDGLDDNGCGYCIDGFMPAFHDVLRTAYRTCPHCRTACATCHGLGRFGASFFDYDDGELTYDTSYLIESFTDHGMRPYFCPTCHGFIVVLPATSRGEQS
jgi:hypothetical protein